MKSHSQPSEKQACSPTEEGQVQCGDAGELSDAERSCPATGMSDVKDAAERPGAK